MKKSKAASLAKPPASVAPVVITAALLPKAEQALTRADAVMGRIIAANNAKRPRRKLPARQPPFHTLVTSVINQQLSQKAAATIQSRVAVLAPEPFAPAGLLAVSAQKLRAAGLSYRKIEYTRALAQAALAGRLEASRLRRLDDERLVADLTAIAGVGQWTAEMFMMFCLRRADVLSLGDAGLRRAARLHYGKRLRGDDAAILAKAAQKWRPWRTIACQHLWRSLP